MHKYFAFFDGRKFETIAPTANKASSNLKFQISRVYRHCRTIGEIDITVRQSPIEYNVSQKTNPPTERQQELKLNCFLIGSCGAKK